MTPDTGTLYVAEGGRHRSDEAAAVELESRSSRSSISSLLDGADADGRDPAARSRPTSTDGASWLPAVAAGSVLVSSGVGAAPAWSAAPLVTSLQIADAGQPNQVLTAAAAGVMSFQTSGGERARLDGSGLFTLGNSGQVRWTSGAPNGTVDTAIARDSTGQLAIRSGTQAQILRVYNTFTDGSNYERAIFGWSGNALIVGTQQAGTGVSRELQLDGSQLTLKSGTIARWIVNAGGHLLANADATYDIGASGASRPRNLFVWGSATLGYTSTVATTSAGPTLGGVWLPRLGDLSSNLVLDYQDEYAFLDGRGATVSVTPASSSGAASDLFHDDSQSLNWVAGLTGGQVQITIDHSTGAAVVPNRNNGAYQIGLTFRSDFVGPGHIKIEAWTSAAGGSFSTVYDANVTIYGGAFGAWVSPAFVSPDATFNMLKTRLTLSGLPDPTTGNFRVQRVALYHSSAPWDMFHLGVGGGTLYGALSFAGTAGGDTTITRTAAGKLSLTGTTPMLQLGGTTSSFPALKQSGAEVLFRAADDSAYAGIQVSRVLIQLNGSLAFNNAIAFTVAPTISSGFGTSPSIANNNGTAAFTVNVGTGGAASSGVIGLPTAANGWICHVTNLTAVAANRADQATRQTASTTTSVTVQNQTLSTGAALAWTAGDVLRVSCFAY
jgi:hypothetical protein